MNRRLSDDRAWTARLEALSIGELDQLEAALEADGVSELEGWAECARTSLEPLPTAPLQPCRGRPAKGGFYVFDGGLAAQPKES